MPESIEETGKGRVFGQRVNRTEDAGLLTGRGRFVDDIHLPETAQAVFARSPHPHALIKSIDGDTARAAPGVLAVHTLDDLKPYLVATRLPISTADPDQPSHSAPGVLAGPEVCHVGEAIAVVIAETRHQAEDAAALIQIDYEILPSVSDCRDALAPDAPPVHLSRENNLSLTRSVDFGDIDAAFSDATHVFQEKLWQHKGAAHSIECRGVLARYEALDDRITVWSSTQVPHRVQGVIAELLGLDDLQVRVIAPAVGGGFGPKFVLYPEDTVIALAARLLGRPVKWIEDRREYFSSTAHERDQFWDMEVAVDDDGRLLGVRGSMIHDQGAFSQVAVNLPYNAATNVSGPYRLPSYRFQWTLALTNKITASAVRGAGYPQGNFAMERLLDRIARELGLDRTDVRRRNLISDAEMPYTSPLTSRDGANIVFDSGNFVGAYEQILQHIDHDGFAVRQAAALEQGRYLGIGTANYTKGTGRGPFESAIVRVGPSGQITVSTGAAEQGQGICMSLAQICAEAFGVTADKVNVVSGDTGAVSIGLGTFASRQAVTAGTSVHLAACELRDKALKIGAHMLEAAEEDLELADGFVRVRGVPDMAVPLGKLAHAVAGTPGNALPGGIEPGMEVARNFIPDGLAYCSGAQAAEVEVDIETGEVVIHRYMAVQDSGRRINPMIVEGQMQGGIVHGMGNALFERLHHDETGQPLTNSLDQYLLPTSSSVPSISLHYDETACSKNPLGIKGVGEGGTVPVPAVIISAVEDALSPFGIAIDRCPIEPMRIVEMIQEARRIS
ncbi:MAG: xanthine dehydrogenase family protein molybdopterin-binding subunit [Rhodospirillaceae bacterium]|jgi:aerobic carbon-monoxide dehydrogenase large subunit|nr:xanthine dehydrogenase family protein molybdopterin-binding subunit [Rhodospirillaceae bacterium]